MPILKPQGQTNPHISVLLAMFPNMPEVLLEEAARAEIDGAQDASHSYRANNQLGCRAAEQIHLFAGVRLEKFGFREEKIGDLQVRHIHDEARVRLLMVRGSKCNGPVFRVSPKGDRTRRLIEENDDLLGHPNTLFAQDGSDGGEGAVLSFWALVESDRVHSISVYLLLPTYLDEHHSAFIHVAEYELLGSRDVPIAEVLGQPLPPGPTTDVSVADFDVELRETPGEEQ